MYNQFCVMLIAGLHREEKEEEQEDAYNKTESHS